MAKTIVICGTLCLFLLLASPGAPGAPSSADIQKLLPANLRIESLTFSPDIGLYEVVAQGNIFYMTPNMKYMFVGNVIEVATRRNLTAEKAQSMRRIDFASLPLADSVKLSDGKRSIAVFSDPDCSFCRKLHGELRKLKDVSVYVFLISIGITPDGKVKADRIWCSENRAKALDDNFNGRSPSGGAPCDTPTERNMALAQAHYINSTPVIVLDNNEVINGYSPSQSIVQAMGSKPAVPPGRAEGQVK